MSIKNNLLSNKVIWDVNAAIKSFHILSRYQYWKRKYDKKKEIELTLPYISSNPNVIFVGTDERQDNSGFYQALSSVCGNVIPFTKDDGRWGQYDSGIPHRKEKNYQRLKELIENAPNCIDCVLMQAWGASFWVKDLNELKKKYKFKIINIDLDSRLIFERIPYIGRQNPGIFGISPCVDLELVSTKEIVNWYHKEGIPAIYFPLASSTSFYYPMDNIEKRYDVGFIGSNYGLRGEEVRFLQAHGIKVEARGPGWPHGSINFEDNNLFFNQCKIVLGIGNISYCKNFYNPKLRDYDAPMSGSVYITNRTPELEQDYLENKEIILFDTWDEAVKRIRELLGDPDRLRAIRKNAYRAAKEKHTYEKQLKELFDTLSKMQR